MPYWLNEAYSSAITSLDIGLIHRNIQIAPILQVLIKSLYNKDARFIDYGGGYGMLVRMMRDRGFDFYRQDIYCENLFSKNFDVDEDLKNKSGFELLTAFEVFEHLPDPIKELEIMLSYSSDIFFSTSIYPKDANLLKWWYLIPETGQHVSLYSEESLKYLASKYNLNYYCFNNIYHLFTKKVISNAAFKRVFNRWNQKIVNRIKPNPASLLDKDFNKISGTKM
ncbi:class I SAM-dependent methyltransferase [Hymenobacter volaticus]|uniref:Class I SAM-dependent methyltransferase n=1 Tax=Hymenobacter volaticus TaxID=2932254 RepID=A0ABY4G8K5_9BACT|nr:class I SAM-dependent methyltransferase [Hymenobacter volaticus]UOQ67213.1 class I SAM-dependent methyltransferase [Hymenobacter volaticus]